MTDRSLAQVDQASARADPRQWRPQVPLPTRRPPTIRDPIVEPLWSGVRVIAHFEQPNPDDEGRAVLLDQDGDDTSDFEPGLTAELARSVMAADAVIDGVLTRQATRTGEGAAVVVRDGITPVSLIVPRDVEINVERLDRDLHIGEVAFVAVDLLRVDGQPLLEIPLLERKRLLEGVIVQGQRIRVSPFTRPPVDPWVASFKAAGFKGAMLKAANGRYRPGGWAEDWTAITRLKQRG